MTLADTSVKDLLDAFSAPTPTPGGGSAAALAGALGASLLAMVAGMPKTRNRSDADRAALDRARENLLRLRDELVTLADLDSAAYNGVMTAFRMATETPDQKTARDNAIQEAIRAATDVPRQTIRTCLALAPLGRAVAEHGNPSAKSDILVGLGLAMAGWSGGVANVTTNLEHVRDEAYVTYVKQELAGMREAVGRDLAPTYEALGISERD